MVCVYCKNQTQVINSRLQKRANQVWRRRKCTECASIFTTIEAVDVAQALSVHRDGRYEAFSRDILLLSIYDSLKHRKTAPTDATALVLTIIGQLYHLVENGLLERDQIVAISTETLERFDNVAATYYKAFHP